MGKGLSPPLRTTSAAWLRGVLGMFDAEGLDSAALLRDSGIDPAAVADDTARFTADEISVLWELAVARSGRPTLGLTRELALAHGNLDAVGYAMMACPTLAEGLERLAKYMDLVSNAATFTLSRSGRDRWLALGHVGANRPVPRQRVEFGMLVLLTLCGWITGRDVRAKVVEFVYPRPADDAPHRAAFRCEVRFGCTENRAMIDAADLAAPLLARNPAIEALHDRVVREKLERIGTAPVSSRVRETIAARLADGEPRRDAVAAALRVSDRTLQRRLSAEGASFKRLVDEVRRELVHGYLCDTDRPLASIAAQAGFADQGTLFRACRRWFGESPAKLRGRLEQAPPAARESAHGDPRGRAPKRASE